MTVEAVSLALRQNTQQLGFYQLARFWTLTSSYENNFQHFCTIIIMIIIMIIISLLFHHHHNQVLNTRHKTIKWRLTIKITNKNKNKLKNVQILKYIQMKRSNPKSLILFFFCSFVLALLCFALPWLNLLARIDR